MEYKLRNMSWSEFDERRKEAKTIIIPSGACEVYGPHMPLGSDIIVAEKISELVAERVNGIVSPYLEVGQSKILMDFPGTLTVSADNLVAVYREIVESFMKWGFKNFMLINTHVHNTFPLAEMFEDLRVEKGIKYAYLGWWQFVPSIAQDVFEHPAPHGHASEAGTSVMLHLAPELVDMSKAPNTPIKVNDTSPSIGKGYGYMDLTDTGTIGDASLGTAEKGKIVVERGVEEICKCITEYLEK